MKQINTYRAPLGGKWDKQDGGVKPVFAQINMDEIIAACDKFLNEREPNYRKNKEKQREYTFGRNRK